MQGYEVEPSPTLAYTAALPLPPREGRGPSFLFGHWMNMIPFSRLTWTSSLLLLCLAVGAEAASLDLSGPSGATVFVDGEEVGTLPLAEALPLTKGTHGLEVRLAGFQNHYEQLRVLKEDSELVLNLSLLPLQRWRAVGYSAVLGGLGQLYEGRSRRGWIMMGLQLGTAIVASYGEARFQNRRDEYEILDRKYADAVAPNEIASLRADRDAVYQDMDSAETLRNAALAGVVAIGLWSVVDAWMGFGDVYVAAGDEVQPLSSTSSSSLGGVRLGWRLQF